MRSDIFRKAALERLSSPEQLDTLMQVTTPKGWIALYALCGVLVTAVFWGILGSIPTKIQGQGILLTSGGVQNLSAMGTGQITEIKVSVGDRVEIGQVIAKISQPELDQQITRAKDELLSLRNQREQDLLARKRRIHEAQRNVEQLQQKWEAASKVVSPYAGHVLEIMEDEWQMVHAGSPIMSLELAGTTLEALLYVPATAGKQIKKGMTVHVAPSTVKQEEFGMMLGKIKSVSEFPATNRGMMRVLENEKLVQEFSAQGAPIEIFAALVRDPQTASGYKWTSSQGPPVSVHSGTMCSGSVTVREQRPISLVIPLLRSWGIGE